MKMIKWEWVIFVRSTGDVFKLPPIASLQFETVLAHVDCRREWCFQLTNKGRCLKSGVYEFDLAELDRYWYRQGTQHYRTLKLQLPLEHVC